VRDRLLDPKVLDKPRRLNPNLSASTEAAIIKAIEVHPSQRFQAASQMRAALGGQGHAIDRAGPPAPLGYTGRPVGRFGIAGHCRLGLG
jgi:hypothetical protein